MDLNEAYELYRTNPSPETKEQFGESLVQYCTAYYKLHFCFGRDTFETLYEGLGNAILSVWKDIDKFDPDRCKFHTWVTMTLKGDIFNEMEKYRLRNEERMHEGIPAPSLYEGIDAKLTLRKLIETLDLLDQQHVRLRLEGHSAAEISVALRVPIAVIRNDWKRILRNLQGAVAKKSV